MDIGSISPVAAGWSAVAAARGNETDTAKTAATGNTGNGCTALSCQQAPVSGIADTRDGDATGSSLARRPPDPDTPTGPPPAFSTTPLELESSLQIRLARLNSDAYAQVQALSVTPERAASGLPVDRAGLLRAPTVEPGADPLRERPDTALRGTPATVVRVDAGETAQATVISQPSGNAV